MKSFIYKIKDDSGKTLWGVLEAADKKDLKRQLRHADFYFIAAYPCDKNKVFQKKVKLDDLLMFTHRLSSLIGAGLPILNAMHILWRQTENRTLQLVISHVRLKLEEGKKISECFDAFPNIFPSIYRALIRVAEKTGTLVSTLEKLYAYLVYQKNIITRTRKATIYPLFVIGFAFVVLIGLFAWVVPVFQKILLRLNVELPIITRIILNISSVLKIPFKSFLSFSLFSLSAIIVGCIVYIIVHALKKNETFLNAFDFYKLKLPILGGILYMISISRFVRSLSILLGSGLPVVESFEVAKVTAVNRRIGNNIEEVKKSVEQGYSLYESFRDIKIFPVLLVEMVGVGETTGSITATFDNLANHFDEEVEFKISSLLTLMEPLLVIFVGIIVIVILLAIYMPIFSMWRSLAG
ncbi:MAG: type II secretion system F family protein [Candidatus Omnitrophica bacterium]|nr:type II secretion system F family protein [Candidatus Omnitrophota bacterium]